MCRVSRDRLCDRWIQRPGNQVEDHLCADRLLLQSLGAHRLDQFQPVAAGGAENGDKLAVTTGSSQQPALHLGQRGRQGPILERCSVAQTAGLAFKKAHIVPGIIDRFVADVWG